MHQRIQSPVAFTVQLFKKILSSLLWPSSAFRLSRLMYCLVSIAFRLSSISFRLLFWVYDLCSRTVMMCEVYLELRVACH